MSYIPLNKDVYQRNTFSLGITVALASWTMVFITLLWGYVVFRLKSGEWLQPYLTREILATALLNTVILGFSSLILRRGKVFYALVLGLIFMAGQYCLWQQAFKAGLHWQKNTAGSFFFLLSGFHSLHILGGLVALAVLWQGYARLKGTSAALGIRYFWDFLMVVWGAMFVLMFIIR